MLENNAILEHRLSMEDLLPSLKAFLAATAAVSSPLQEFNASLVFLVDLATRKLNVMVLEAVLVVVTFLKAMFARLQEESMIERVVAMRTEFAFKNSFFCTPNI